MARQTKKTTLPAAVQQQLAAKAAKLKDNLKVGGGNVIKTSGKEFTFPDGTTDSGPISLVILSHAYTNSFYPGKYNPKDVVPPECFAVSTPEPGDDEIEAMVPVKNSPNMEAKACNTCPNNQFGSDGNGKACKNGITLAVVAPDADAEADIYLLKVAPTALKYWRKYMANLLNTDGVMPIQVVTDISFDEASEYPVLRFRSNGENQELDVHASLIEQANQAVMAEPLFTKAEKKPVRGRGRGRAA